MNLRTMTAAEIITAVTANRANWVKAKNELMARGEYTAEHAEALAIAVDAATRTRKSADGYFSNY